MMAALTDSQAHGSTGSHVPRLASVLLLWAGLCIVEPVLAQGFRAGIADSWLREGNPSDSHGGDDELRIKGEPADNFRAVFSFDLSGVPINANVTVAEAWIRITSEDDSGLPVNIHRVTESWDESTVTWASTGEDFDPDVVGSFVADRKGWAKIDISALVQSWICGEFQDYGVMLIPTSSNEESRYASREWRTSGQRPRLRFSYSGTNPCADSADHFVVVHDTFGIHCLAERVTVRVEDATNNPISSYAEQVTLDTQTGRGTWTLVTGTGTFVDATADDGLATYDWPSGESEAVFSLSYPEGTPVLDIDAYQSSDTTLRDDDTEGTMTFSPNGFTLTASLLGNPPPALVAPFAATQIAATAFPVYITAFGQTPNDPLCGVIEGYTGAKGLSFWSQYLDPLTGSILMEVDGSPVAVNEAAAALQNVVFVNGQASVAARYDDVGSKQLFVKDDTTLNAELPGGIRGATAGFVVRPARFVVSDVRNAAGALPNPQALDASGPVFIAAGTPFRATVTALDADGDPTPNYGREVIPESVRFDVELLDPLGGASPPVSAASGLGPFSAGVATGLDFIWPEVGIMRVVPGIGDGDYLGAGDVSGDPSENIGRFIPDHFNTALNVPMFQTSCVAGGFTYQGETFNYLAAPVITATAQAAGGSTTLNYTGAFFKIDATTLQNRAYASGAGTLDLSGLPPPAGDPAVVEAGPGVGTLTFSGGSGLAFSRSSPAAPFAADIQLSVDVLDADGVAALGNPVTFGGGGGISFSAGDEIRYGRVRMTNAVGSELVDLPVPMVTEYFSGPGGGFFLNAADTCSGNVSLSLSSFTEALAPGETCVLDNGAPGDSALGCAAAAPPGMRFAEPPLAGDFNLRLAAPGDGNQGSAIVTGAVPNWLKFDWAAASPGEEDPSAQVTFGIFGGNSRQIYTRELY